MGVGLDGDTISMGVALLVAMYVYESMNKGDGKKKKRGINIWDSLGIADIVLVPVLVVFLGSCCLGYFSKLSHGIPRQLFPCIASYASVVYLF
jgi:hypothetical protein